MPSTPSLIARLQSDFNQFKFVLGDQYKWSPSEQTVYVDQTGPIDEPALLHELAHAVLGHDDYIQDIKLIEMESAAWDYALNTLGVHYGVTISAANIQDSLDSYRDWLHARSSCPGCNATGIQVPAGGYRCLTCRTTWTANEARLRALRRYRSK